jgi:hypothetical protein
MKEVLLSTLRAHSIGVFRAFPILLLALVELIEEVAGGAGKTLELIALAGLEAGGVEGRADRVGVESQSLLAQLAIAVRVVGEAVRTVGLALHAILQVVASIALHTGVILHVIAVGKGAAFITADYEGGLTEDAAGGLGLQAVLDHTCIGKRIEDERRVAELASTAFVHAAVISWLAALIRIEVVSRFAFAADSIGIVGFTVGVLKNALSIEEGVACLASGALVVCKLDAVDVKAHADAVGEAVSTGANSAAISV